ncbi:MAG TPA: TonB family protein [Lysobacter sp.]|nr:TonB family protein [Lysobacter sp.]
MTAAELLEGLGEVTVALTLALLAVLLMRRPLRAFAGPCVAYTLWLLAPVAAIAVLLPAKAATPPTWDATAAATNVHLAAQSAIAVAAWDRSAALLAVWACGALATAVWLLRQQRAFRRRLGRLRRRGDGAWQAEAVAGLPAALGVWRPRVLVPADFETRYSTTQRRLMLAHERTHIRSADLHLNALAALLRCLLWFHPLAHFAVGRFRHDQELACDARIMARHPRSRRAYGEAMLKTQLAAQALPLGCHWGHGHPLKERIAMLRNTRPAPLRWVAGALLVAGVIGAGALTAWAAQPARVLATDPEQATLDITVRFDGGAPITSTGRGALGGVQRGRYEHGGQRWDLETTLSRRDDGNYEIHSTMRRDGIVVAQPRLVAALRTPAKIAIGDGEPGSAAFRGIEIEYTIADQPARVVADVPMAEATRQSRLDNVPVYPPEALQKGIGGTVVLLVDVGADGVPTDVRVERAEPAGVFDAAAIEAVRKWRFPPATEDGKPVAGRVRVPITFEPPVAAGTPRV